MKIAVCVKPTADGEWNPFDACAYEEALRIPDSQVVLLSMGPERTEEMLSEWTRLGAAEAHLLCDGTFAGADTLATAYALSLAVRRIAPDLVICGRKTIDGETAQTGPALAQLLGYPLITNVMEILSSRGELVCRTRDMGIGRTGYPALITVERINRLRLPSIRSRRGRVIRWTAGDVGADPARCGLAGSPTRVLKTFHREEGTRNCRMIDRKMLGQVIQESLRRETGGARCPGGMAGQRTQEGGMQPAGGACFAGSLNGRKMQYAFAVGDTLRPWAEAVAETVAVVEPGQFSAGDLAEKITAGQPDVVLWGNDSWSKAEAPRVAALLGTGLCADCTRLETDGSRLYMYRPAYSGSLIAEIVCTVRPAMATVRTAEDGAGDIICGLGKGAAGVIARMEQIAEQKNAEGKVRWEIAATRAAVDAGMLPYDRQVGLTGRTVRPAVYLAVGISGAAHHIVGIRQSGTIIAVNPDRNAPIFRYADYGIVSRAEDILPELDYRQADR